MLNSLKIKSVLIISLFLTCFLVIIFCIFILFTVNNILTASLIDRGKTEIASLITIQTDNHIPKEIFSETDLTKTQKTFEDFFKEIDTVDVLRIKVWNKNAEIISANDPDIIGKKFSDNDEYQKAMKGEIIAEIKAPVGSENIKETGYSQLMEVYVPIRSFNGEIVGVVETYTILDAINNQIRSAQINLALKIIAFSTPLIILLGGLFLVFYRRISRSIDRLTEFTKILGQGQLDKKLDIQSNDELSGIAVAINKMSSDLSELLLTKTELEKQVKDRTENLRLKMDDIERINRLMIDRELRMIELKKEVSDLKDLLKNTSK